MKREGSLRNWQKARHPECPETPTDIASFARELDRQANLGSADLTGNMNT